MNIVLANLTDFDAHPVYKQVGFTKLNGEEVMEHIPGHWDLSWGVERNSPVLDQLVDSIDAQYYVQGSFWHGTLYQYVTERSDGSLSSYQFPDLRIQFPDLGKWAADQSVKQRVSGWARTRMRL